ncbi:MAG: polysaccharide biosynthesis C-terminal domain-containing protein [Candidatus Fermentibacteraceae bacterium]|nr:polysaccharide biosynthesis C-terminal domain-containing protein [Candidatus Fermentibacteraceae bacterium]
MNGTEHRRDLSRESVLYAMAMVFSGMVQVAFLPFISRFLSAEAAGELGTLRILAEAIAGIVVLGLPTALIRAWHRSGLHRAILVRGMVFPLVPTTLMVASVFLLRGFLVSFLNLRHPEYLVHASLLGVGIAYVQITLSLPRAEGLAGRYLVMQLARGLLALGALAFLLYATSMEAVPSFLTARWAPSFLLAAFTAIMMWKRTAGTRAGTAPGEENLTGEILSFSLPLIPATISMIVLSSADMFMLRSIHPDLAQSGYYEWASRACLILMPMVLGFDMAWKRFIFRKKNTGGTLGELGRAGLLFMIMINWASLVLAMSSPWLVPLVGGADYLPAAGVLPTLAGAGALYGLFLISQTGCLLTGQTRFIAWMTLFGALLNIGFNFRLIPVAGALGAAFATLATNLFMALSLFWLGRNVFPISFLMVVLTVIPPVALGPLATLGPGWRTLAVLLATAVTLLVIWFMRASGTRLVEEDGDDDAS